MTGAEVLVGPALKLLLMLAKEMYKINSLFEPLMKELIDMLEDFEPLIKEVEKSENSEPIQNALRGLQSKMDEGQTLMEKCSKVTRSKVLEKRKRNKELVALQKDLQRRLNLLSSYALNDLRGRNTGVAGSITVRRE
ncbi:hypothetical protein M0R45_006449 [Rubus argutus]|uniref:RPW8 domain-containing protein n=1 Tax=Rubus argutus TaxID=59490 RepID=A0AAW1YQM6_RUBAR